MPPCIFTLPTTGALSWSSILHFTPPSTSPHLSTTTTHRARLRDVLKRLKRASPADQDSDLLSVIKVIEEYLPYLFWLARGLKEGWISTREGGGGADEVRLDWRCTLLDTKVPGKSQPRIENLPGIDYEILFVLLTYAYALSNYASSLLTRPSSPSASSPASASDRRWNQAAENYARAAGVFTYLINTTLPSLLPFSTTLPETSPHTLNVLHLTSFASAQHCALLRAASTGKTSPGVLARLAASSYEHLSAASGALSSTPSHLDTDLKKHILTAQKQAKARVLLYMGHESEKRGEMGEAVAASHAALALSAGDAPLQKECEEAWRAWKKINDGVTFLAVPGVGEVVGRMPSGREIVGAKEFVEPMLEREDGGDEITGSKAAEYAGKGQYY
ncbi:hypothetical protein YB2330_004780 [Saitoella coloradoensis]